MKRLSDIMVLMRRRLYGSSMSSHKAMHIPLGSSMSSHKAMHTPLGSMSSIGKGHVLRNDLTWLVISTHTWLSMMTFHVPPGSFCFGHSLGASLALLVEASHPGSFAAIFAWEPPIATRSWSEEHRCSNG